MDRRGFLKAAGLGAAALFGGGAGYVVTEQRKLAAARDLEADALALTGLTALLVSYNLHEGLQQRLASPQVALFGRIGNAEVYLTLTRKTTQINVAAIADQNNDIAGAMFSDIANPQFFEVYRTRSQLASVTFTDGSFQGFPDVRELRLRQNSDFIPRPGELSRFRATMSLDGNGVLPFQPNYTLLGEHTKEGDIIRSIRVDPQRTPRFSVDILTEDLPVYNKQSPLLG